MRYIRTKNGRIYKLVSGLFGNDIPIDKDGNVNFTIVGKKADTIEELCDEFVWVWNENEFPYSTLRRYTRIGGLGDLTREIRCQLNYGKNLNYDYKVFGAIWINKGLIYVAKMNDKGELELL